MKNAQKTVADSSGEIVKYAQEGMPQLEVWLEDETIWLTQKQMGELFGVKEHTITYHIKGIEASGELEGTAVSPRSFSCGLGWKVSLAVVVKLSAGNMVSSRLGHSQRPI